jgi:hypothetical protein
VFSSDRYFLKADVQGIHLAIIGDFHYALRQE